MSELVDFTFLDGSKMHNNILYVLYNSEIERICIDKKTMFNYSWHFAQKIKKIQ